MPKDQVLHGRSQDFFRGGGTLFQKIFQKILKEFSKNVQIIFQKIFKKISKTFKNFLMKIAKMHYFRLVFSQFNQAWGQFLRVWTKNAISRKFSKNFLQKIVKNALF